MASGLFSSIQSISTKLLEAIRGTTSPDTDRNESVREDLEKLSRMLASIQAVQQDAEEREIHDRSVRLWLAELRGVAYQAEDVLDEFYYEVLRSIVESGDAAVEAYHREGGIKRKFSEMYTSSSLASYSFTITKASIPDGMAEKIKCITKRFEEISNARRDLHLREEDGTRLDIGPQILPPTSSHVDERAIFGREDEKEKIVSLLNPENGPEFMVLPIVGMGGFGKTTLAQLVFNDSRIRGLFKKRCWVSVSEDFDLVRLTKAIVDSLSGKCRKPLEFSELNILQDILKENIRGHGLFIVLDDVWNEKKILWECFRVGFFGAKVVRILTTTRNTSVAKVMQTTSPIQLGSLPEESCWSLFKHFAFGTREASVNANLHKIGCDIVKKCKCSPLAIKALGGILHYEMDEEKWMEILESDISEIDESGEIMPALRLSYQKLPEQLKPCFLYLSMFPKGTPFKKDMVVRLWMAQGYINGNARNLKTLEKIGSEYFDELQGRSLVERALVDGGLFYTHLLHGDFYRLHDLIHDLARSISHEAYRPVSDNDQHYSDPCKVYHLYLTEKDKLLGSFLVPSNYVSIRTVVKECSTQIFDNAIFSEIACARALQLRYSLLPSTLCTLKHLRYLFVEHHQMEILPETLCLLYNLQTLDLNCSNLRELPENIKNLINLRYFHLWSNKIQQLPKSIFLLCNLHTLSLIDCTQLKELPRGIEKLTRLRILDLPESLIYMPSGIGKLTTLKPLRGKFRVMENEMIGGLGELSGMLCISGLINIGDLENSRNVNLASMPNLHNLILNFQEVSRCRTKFPHLHLDIESSTNAKNKNDEKIQEVVLQSLQPHSNLEGLEIYNYGGRIFPSWLLIPLFPKLKVLILNFCTEPNFLPPFGQLPCLNLLEISGNTEVRNVGDELNTYSLLAEYCHSKQPKKPSYPSLEVLALKNLLNLVEWQAHDSDFPCLKKVSIKNCPKLKALTCPSIIKTLRIHKCGFSEINFQSISERLTISNCVELISINWSDGGLNSIEYVTFECCPKLELITIPVPITSQLKIYECGFREIKFQSISKRLTISNCVELISINWSDGGLNSIEDVTFKCCPKLKLQFPAKDVLNSMIQKAEIYDCPRIDLGKSFHYVYQRDTKIKELKLIGNDEIHLSLFNSPIQLLEIPFTLFLTKEDFREAESLTCAPSVGVRCQCIMLNLVSLVILEIYRCRKVISVTGLDNLSNLKCVSISYCPELCNWNDKTLPLSLKFLELDSCDKLSSLPLLSIENYSSNLKVLVIMKCPRLAVLQGFHGLMKLKNVELLHCRNISISPATENLQFRPLITIGGCPLMRDWCQRNSITYSELIYNPKDDREAKLESAQHESGERESGEEGRAGST